MIIFLSLSLICSDALCDDWSLPPRPPPPPPIAGECPEASGLDEGEAAPCSGVLIPTSEALEALQMLRHLDRVEDVVGLRQEAHGLEVQALEERIAFYAGQLEPARWYQSHQARYVLGVGTGVALTLGVAWGWGQMARGVSFEQP